MIHDLLLIAAGAVLMFGVVVGVYISFAKKVRW